MARRNSGLDFEIEQDGEIFPNKKQKEQFGFRPLDVFLVDEAPKDDVLEPRVVFYGESSEEIVENIEDDLLLASRYVLEGFDIDNSVSIPWGVKDYPAVQREFSEACISIDDDFKGFLQLIDDGFENFDKTLVYRLETRKDGKVERSTEIDEYIDTVSEGPLDAWPDVYGLNSVRFSPESFKACFALYRQEVMVPQDEEVMRENGIGGEDYWETERLNYDEDPIDDLRESLERQGFSTETEYLPPTAAPSEGQ